MLCGTQSMLAHCTVQLVLKQCVVTRRVLACSPCWLRLSLLCICTPPVLFPTNKYPPIHTSNTLTTPILVDDSSLGRLDSSVKKNGTFIKKLRALGCDNRQQLLAEADKLNLSKVGFRVVCVFGGLGADVRAAQMKPTGASCTAICVCVCLRGSVRQLVVLSVTEADSLNLSKVRQRVGCVGLGVYTHVSLEWVVCVLSRGLEARGAQNGTIMAASTPPCTTLLTHAHSPCCPSHCSSSPTPTSLVQYVSEAVIALCESPLKAADIPAVVAMASALHRCVHVCVMCGVRWCVVELSVGVASCCDCVALQAARERVKSWTACTCHIIIDTQHPPRLGDTSALNPTSNTRVKAPYQQAG